MAKKHTEGNNEVAEGGRGRPDYPKRGQWPSIPMKVPEPLPPLLNSLADWLNDYQYRVLLRLVVREIKRQGMLLPPYKQAVVDQVLADLGDDPKDVGKLKPVPIPGA